jgi:hypothetical protein
MKNKIITITAFLAVMAAMTGTAAADQLNVYYDGTSNLVTNSVDLTPGGAAVPLDVGVTFDASRSAPGNVHTFVCSVVPNSGGGSADDITVNAVERGTSNSAPPFPLSWTQDGGAGTTEYIDITIASKATAPQGATYSIVVTDMAFGGSFTFQAATISTSNIPEFPAVAVPVAGVIGLVFFFQHRKRKQE